MIDRIREIKTFTYVTYLISSFLGVCVCVCVCVCVPSRGWCQGGGRKEVPSATYIVGTRGKGVRRRRRERQRDKRGRGKTHRRLAQHTHNWLLSFVQLLGPMYK
jgi:hypothetical protein